MESPIMGRPGRRRYDFSHNPPLVDMQNQL